MPLESQIVGATSGVGADVTSSKELMVALNKDASKSGYVQLAGTLSAATEPGGLIVEEIRTSAQGRLSVGQPVAVFNEVFFAAAVNSAIFSAPVTTFTVVSSAGFLLLNASAVNTANAVARVTTYQTFPLYTDLALYCLLEVSLSQPPQTNNTVEFGMFFASAVTLPTDGTFFRLDATGTLKAILNTNGVEVSSAALNTPPVAEAFKVKIVIENDRVMYYINGECQAVINAPVNSGRPVYSSALPFNIRTFNGISPTLAQVVKVASILIAYQDAAGLGLDMLHLASAQGRMGSQGQTGNAMGSTSNYTNSLAVGAGAVLSNTAAAATGLGGQIGVQPTLAVGTDGILISYQNPAASTVVGGKTLFIKGIRITSIVTTTLVGGPVTFFVSLCYGHTAVSLATTESATTKAPRRRALGYESYVANAVAQAGAFSTMQGGVKFDYPIAINPGEFVAIALKNIGTVTTAGVITYLVDFDAEWG